jgi:heme/copper-type cytochrome/quinol oxidase subunit 2
MPKLSSVDVLFKRTPEGWTFKSAYPRMFGQPSTYLLTGAEKAALEERLNHVVLWSRVLVFIFVVSGALALFMVRAAAISQGS